MTPYPLALFCSILLIVTGALSATANELAVGDTVEDVTFEDQHGNSYERDEAVQTYVMAFEMSVSKKINQWLEKEGGDYLADREVFYIADITPMPVIISKLFAMPKMRKYKHRILLVRDDAFGDRYPKEEDKVTVLRLDAAGQVQEILFVEPNKLQDKLQDTIEQD